MQLKSLEIAGFKSFAKKSTLSFEESITAIVGPNGSGKSNVAEAFRFVLGEQSIKSMRGKRGEDLIFNGTTAAGRQNKGTVRVTLDNHDHLLPIDYDEVTIERTVHRDGSNEYAINGSSVRLKDITELLAKANIGPTGHHIISQGEADRILNATPKDRRAILEDALGLKVFQFKKTESEKKLAKTEENVVQIELQRKEIAPHLRFLKKQVEKVEKAQALREELTQEYQEYLAREHLYITKTKATLSEKITPLTKEIDELQQQLVEHQKSIAEHKEAQADNKTDELITLENKLQDVRQQKSDIVRQIGQLEGEASSLQRLQERAERQKEADDVKVSLRDVEELEREIQGLQADSVQSLLERVRATLKSFIQKYKSGGVQTSEEESYEQDLVEIASKKQQLEKEVVELEKQESEILAQMAEVRKVIESSKTGLLEVEKEVLALQSQKSELVNQRAELQRQLDVLERDKEEFDREIQEAMVLVGREAAHHEAFKVSADEVLGEDRKYQMERRRGLEKKKIRLEELGGGSSSEIMKEFEETTERDEFLAKELEDLDESSRKLKQLIKELEEEVNRRFRNGVQSINKEFQHFFELMFGGGEAALKLVQPPKSKKKDTDLPVEDAMEDEEEAEEGIDIAVSLPRKKVKGLMMLSGGERALTSIALIFAMSAVNPPPFIILDETDAALDEANSRKYADMIENLSQHSQLILITHNRETMSRASTIYGVTMMQGISELLSIKFDEGVKYAK